MRGMLKCLAFAGCTAVMMSGCGGSGNSSSGGVSTGVFVDAPVKGLYYECGNIKGKTDESGAYTYVAGQPVTFKLGKITIGTADGASYITPKDLAKKADSTLSGTSLDDAAKKIVRFLLSVGTVSSSNITISSAVYNNASTASTLSSINLLSSDSAVSSAVTALGGTLASTSDVDTHYSQYINDASFIAKAKYAGRYIAVNTAVDTGVDLVIAPDGTLKGVAASTDGSKEDIVGTVNADGVISGTVYQYNSSTVDATFTGTFANGAFTLVVTDASTNAKSNWVIQRTTDYLNPFAGIYTGNFTGTLSGTWGVIVLSDGRILGYANGIRQESCSGTVNSAGSISMTCRGATGTGAIGTGTMSGSGVSGSWTESPYSGTFSGTKLVTTK